MTFENKDRWIKNTIYLILFLFSLSAHAQVITETVHGDLVVEGDITCHGDYASLAYGGTVTANTVSALTVTGNTVYVDGFLNVGHGVFQPFYSQKGDVFIQGEEWVGEGMNTRARLYGVGVQVLASSPAKSPTFYTDVDFYAPTSELYDADGTFVDDGVVTGNMVAITSGLYLGAVGEIIGVTGNTTLFVNVAASGMQPLASVTGMGMAVYNHPIMAVLDNGFVSYKIGTNENTLFEIHGTEYSAAEKLFFLDGKSGVTGHTVMDIEFDSEVTGSTVLIGFDYEVNKFKNGFIGTILDMVIDIDGSTGGRVECMDVVVVGEGTAEVAAIATYGDADVIRQHIGTDTSLAEAYTFDVTFTSVTTAFDSAASNVQIFVSDDDYVLVAAATQFDEIEWILDTTASANCLFTFEYNTADAVAWTVFSPADDTDGLQHSGIHRFDRDSIPAWGLASPSQIIGDADNTDLYWMRITRTRNNLVTIPIESTVILVSIDSDCEWDKVGHITSNTVRSNTLKLSEIASPSETPAPNTAWLYLDIADSGLKIRWDDGSVDVIQAHP